MEKLRYNATLSVSGQLHALALFPTENISRYQNNRIVELQISPGLPENPCVCRKLNSSSVVQLAAKSLY